MILATGSPHTLLETLFRLVAPLQANFILEAVLVFDDGAGVLVEDCNEEGSRGRDGTVVGCVDADGDGVLDGFACFGGGGGGGAEVEEADGLDEFGRGNPGGVEDGVDFDGDGSGCVHEATNDSACGVDETPNDGAGCIHQPSYNAADSGTSCVDKTADDATSDVSDVSKKTSGADVGLSHRFRFNSCVD